MAKLDFFVTNNNIIERLDYGKHDSQVYKVLDRSSIKNIKELSADISSLKKKANEKYYGQVSCKPPN